VRHFLAIVTLMSCGSLHSSFDSGAMGGGSSSTGGGSNSSGGGSSSSGGGAGGSGGGGGTIATGGGIGTGGGTSNGWPYTYETLTLTPSDMHGPIDSISGRSGDIYAAADYGFVYHSTDGVNFTALPNLGNRSVSMLAVYVAPTGDVFLSTGIELGVCHSNCTQAASYTWRDMNARYSALCGDSASNVFAVGASGSNAYDSGSMVRWTGSAWGAETALPIDGARSCWLESSSVLWIGGLMQVAKWNNGALSAQGVDTSIFDASDQLSQQWLGIFGIDGWIHAVGVKRRVMSRNPSGVWSLTYDPSDSNWLRAVGALRVDEVIAGGFYGAEHSTLLRFDQSTWRAAPDLAVLGEVRTMWVADGSTIYFGGAPAASGSAGHPAIERATRN
jgi:hypothetical protein